MLTTVFQSNYSPIDHPGFDVHFVYEYPKADSILPQQRSYIATYVDSLEDALYGANFADTSIGYRKYLDTKSFIDYFIVNELANKITMDLRRVYFSQGQRFKWRKTKSRSGLGFWLGMEKPCMAVRCLKWETVSDWAHHVNDCPTDNYSCGWYVQCCKTAHSSMNYIVHIKNTEQLFFRYELYFRNHWQCPQSRTECTGKTFSAMANFRKSGPAPELDPAATTYDAELDTVEILD